MFDFAANAIKFNCLFCPYIPRFLHLDVVTNAMALENVALEHVPSGYGVYVGFFRDVTNADFLHQQLLSRNRDFEYAFIDASSVISRLHLLSAVYSALNTLLVGALRTPNVHSEIVTSFNTNNNVRAPSK